MKKTKVLSILLAVLFFLVPVLPVSAAAQPRTGQPPVQQLSQQRTREVKVILNGQELEFDVPPTIMNGRTMVPMRVIFEALGAKLEWQGEIQSVYGKMSNNVEIRLWIGQNVAEIDGQLISLDQSPVVINGRTLVPLRFVAEASGANVEWDPANRAAIINSMEHQQGRQPGRIWNVGDALPENAPWDQSQYRNNNLPSQRGISDSNIRTNSRLLQDLQAFNTNHASRSNNPPPVMNPDSFGFSNPPLTDNDIRLKNMFVDLFCDGWDNDSLAQVMPFSSSYIREMLGDVDIYFANHSSIRDVGGHYYKHVHGDINQMFVATGDTMSRSNYVHEVGRALGLNHSLTKLLSLEFVGEYSPLIEDAVYTPTFDYTLHSIVGAEQFWNAAFTSNDEYKSLWTQHMPVSHEDVEMLRSLIYHIQQGNSELMQRYQRAGGRLSQQELYTLPPKFAVAFDQRMSHEWGESTRRGLAEIYGFDINNKDEVIRQITTTANIAREIGVVNVFEQHVRDDIIQNTPVAIAQREAQLAESQLGQNAGMESGQMQSAIGVAPWDQPQFQNQSGLLSRQIAPLASNALLVGNDVYVVNSQSEPEQL